AQAAREHFVSAVQSYVRPELFNRIDRLVPFAPLGADVIRGIAERHLTRLEGRDGIRYRGVTVAYGAGVADRLARNGFDARYGARPLLRTVERDQERFDKAQQNYARRVAKLANAPEEVRRRLMPRQPRVGASEQRRMTELARLRAIAARFDELAEGGHVIEEEALQALYAGV